MIPTSVNVSAIFWLVSNSKVRESTFVCNVSFSFAPHPARRAATGITKISFVVIGVCLIYSAKIRFDLCLIRLRRPKFFFYHDDPRFNPPTEQHPTFWGFLFGFIQRKLNLPLF